MWYVPISPDLIGGIDQENRLMMYSKYDVYKITEMRHGAVYKTRLVASVWFSPYDTDDVRKATAQRLGGDQVCPSSGNEYVFQKVRPVEVIYDDTTTA